MTTALQARSSLERIRVKFTGIVVNPDGSVSEVELASLVAAPKKFSTGSYGFYVSGKLHDLSEPGMGSGVKYDIGCNVVAVGSHQWDLPETAADVTLT